MRWGLAPLELLSSPELEPETSLPSSSPSNVQNLLEYAQALVRRDPSSPTTQALARIWHPGSSHGLRRVCHDAIHDSGGAACLPLLQAHPARYRHGTNFHRA